MGWSQTGNYQELLEFNNTHQSLTVRLKGIQIVRKHGGEPLHGHLIESDSKKGRDATTQCTFVFPVDWQNNWSMNEFLIRVKLIVLITVLNVWTQFCNNQME